MPVNLYVYYQPAQGDATLAQRVRHMQRTLAVRHAVQAHLLRRCDDPSTWMEIYEGIADRRAFSLALAQALRDSALEADSGTRHEEWFAQWAAEPDTLG